MFNYASSQMILFTRNIYVFECFTFSLSFSAHHLFFLVREWPSTFTCEKKYKDDVCKCFLSLKTFSVPKAMRLVPLGPNGTWPPNSNWQCLQFTWKVKVCEKSRKSASFWVQATFIFLPTLSHTCKLLFCTVCEHSGFIVKKMSWKIQKC